MIKPSVNRGEGKNIEELLPVLDATLIVLDPEKDGAYNETQEYVDSQLHRGTDRQQQ